MIKVEQLLRETMGLDATSIGSSTIQRVVRLRMKSLGCKDPVEYRQVLKSSPVEWNELVESVVVTETWFFREKETFSAMVRLSTQEWKESGRMLRLLSVPCSSGEEPYSIVIALREAPVAFQFQVDAFDISSRSLEKARKGIYTRNSFRGKDLGFRNRYFRLGTDGYALSPEIRNFVNFKQGNFLDPDWQGNSKYDFIFCRNLLIYFDADRRKIALDRLSTLLTPSGVLFVGPAETPLAMQAGFVSANLPMAFACRKRGSARIDPQIGWAKPIRTVSKLMQAAPQKSRLFEASRRDSHEISGAIPTAAIPANGLEDARRLADAGRLKEAADLCQAWLELQGPSAQAYFLLGLVCDASHDANAEAHYRKALYLQPDHYDTLVQMALHSEKNGETSRAQAFRSRAVRAKEKSETT